MRRLARSTNRIRAIRSALAAWPKSAIAMVAILIGFVAVFVTLWAVGRRPWGPLDIDAVGSLGDWVSGLGAVAAVSVTVWQFIRTRRAEREHEERAEAMRVTAWAKWTTIGDSVHGHDGDSASSAGEGVRGLTVQNGSQGALYDWNVTIVPSESGWVDYVHLSSRVGQIPPDGRITINVQHAPEGVTVRRYGKEDRAMGIPRFVVVAFTDAWGKGWIRVNGDIQKVPRESHFVPRLVHLRNPAMPWAGILDQAEWSAFRDAIGSPDSLPGLLSDLIPEKRREYPWLGREVIDERSRSVLAARLRERGTLVYSYPERAVVRTVGRASAYRRTQEFFRAVTLSTKGELLYLRQD